MLSGKLPSTSLAFFMPQPSMSQYSLSNSQGLPVTQCHEQLLCCRRCAVLFVSPKSDTETRRPQMDHLAGPSTHPEVTEAAHSIFRLMKVSPLLTYRFIAGDKVLIQGYNPQHDYRAKEKQDWLKCNQVC